MLFVVGMGSDTDQFFNLHFEFQKPKYVDISYGPIQWCKNCTRRIWTACLVETMPFVRQMVLNVRSNYVYVLITKLISWFYNSVVSSAVKDLIFWTIVVGPAAFRPRAHATANYTPSVEKGRPILQGLLSIDFLAKEVFEIFSV